MTVILIVDDEPIVHALLTKAITNAGHTALSASSGKDALDLARRYRPSLIICDIVMPQLDGYAFVNALRAEPDPIVAGTPVVLISAFPMPESAKPVDATAFLPKPLDLKVIQSFLQKLE